MSEPAAFEKSIYKPSDIAKLMDVTADTVRIWCASGKIEGAKLINGRWYVSKEALKAFLTKEFAP